eukprot:maker-scaffold807_size94382-snap-gene-0.20 protein:Tk06572 transcript:maker-scaffold807_size94382-snap-gene-0.20-mRNA-1 annotation:"acyl- -binding domain-containing protein 5-like isoform x1"
MSVEDQFKAAVNVIQGLPKSGSFQPSNEMMLKFYAYYKQANEGPCAVSKPAFWDVVKRAKFDAWNGLGQMSQSEAMKGYIEELKKIIEVMSFSHDVASFTEILGPFYEYLSQEEAEAVANEAEDNIQPRVEQIPFDTESRLVGREHHANDICEALGKYADDDRVETDEESASSSLERRMGAFADDLVAVQQTIQSHHRNRPYLKLDFTPKPIRMHDIHVGRLEIESSADEEDCFHEAIGEWPALGTYEPSVLHSAQLDQESNVDSPMTHSLKHALELLQKDVENIQLKVSQMDRDSKSHWPCQELSKSTMFFVITWPFVAHGLISMAHSFRK